MRCAALCAAASTRRIRSRSLMLRVVSVECCKDSTSAAEQAYADACRLGGWCICYAIALKHHLRGEPFVPLSHLALRGEVNIKRCVSEEIMPVDEALGAGGSLYQ